MRARCSDGPSIFLKSYFVIQAFLETCFSAIVKISKILFAPPLRRGSLWRIKTEREKKGNQKKICFIKMNNFPTELLITVEEIRKSFIKHWWKSVFSLSANCFTISFFADEVSLPTVDFIIGALSVKERFPEAVAWQYSVKWCS